MTNTMLEMCARAMFESEPHRHPRGSIPDWDKQPEHLRDQYRNRVRAVLTTLLSPTEEMIEAAHTALAGDGDVSTVFTSMIRAAAGEPT